MNTQEKPFLKYDAVEEAIQICMAQGIMFNKSIIQNFAEKLFAKSTGANDSAISTTTVEEVIAQHSELEKILQIGPNHTNYWTPPNRNPD